MRLNHSVVTSIRIVSSGTYLEMPAETSIHTVGLPPGFLHGYTRVKTMSRQEQDSSTQRSTVEICLGENVCLHGNKGRKPSRQHMHMHTCQANEGCACSYLHTHVQVCLEADELVRLLLDNLGPYGRPEVTPGAHHPA